MALFALALIKRLENSAPPSHHGLYLFQNRDNLWTLQKGSGTSATSGLAILQYDSVDASGWRSLFKASNVHQNSDQKSLEQRSALGLLDLVDKC